MVPELRAGGLGFGFQGFGLRVQGCGICPKATHRQAYLEDHGT